ncbi:tetratricopeptide repeat protein, partial [Streptomyces sp. NRRL F-6602]
MSAAERAGRAPGRPGGLADRLGAAVRLRADGRPEEARELLVRLGAEH